ncbi:MAG: hypothetical protein JNL08_21025 [Planctomycetes bacterium]|nr:hypothetical protein [Planctomycetota bacterium]
MPVLSLGLAAPILAQSPYVTTIVYVNTPGHPTNVVPGLGIPFDASPTTPFERPIVSANGLHFGINVLANTATTADDDVLIVDGALVIREGSPAPWNLTENVGTIDAEFGLNDAGDLLIGNNTSAAANDDVVALFSGGVWTELAREGSLISATVPGLAGDAGNTGTWDDATDTVRLSNVGFFWRGEGVDNLATVPTTLNDEILVLGAGAALQKGVHFPTGQAGGATNAYENFALEQAFVSPDGSVVIFEADLLGATTGDEVIVVNGAVVAQEGVVLPGSAFVNGVDSLGIVKVWVDHANTWWARGNNDITEDDWVLRNGVVVADSVGADEIVAGTGEHWTDAPAAGFGDCFFAFDGNSLGHYVIGGVTDNPVTTLNGVIVFHDGLGNDYVVVRESDPVDLDGNGLFDDNTFYNTFGNDDVLLLDDGTVIFTATLKNAAGTATGQGVFRLTPTTASCTFRNGSGINPVAVACTTLPIVGSTWTIDVSFGPQTLGTFLFADPTPIPAFPLFGGELLIAPSAFQLSSAFGAPAPLNLALPYGYQGLAFSLQAIRLDFNGVDVLFVLTNAQDAVIGT